GIYAEILIVITAAAILAEMLPGNLPLFYFHDYLFVYLLSIGIMVFIIIQGVRFRRYKSSKNDESDSKLSPALPKTEEQKCLTDINIFFKIGAASKYTASFEDNSPSYE
ncbi:hypothetical protein AVEN_172094-1, partial [Araneus ventricosus]